MILLAASLFFVRPAPVEMPRAEAYLVREGERMMLEDRYDELDLWTSRSVVGRWSDDDGRQLLLARLEFAPPAGAPRLLTRTAYAANAVPLDPRREDLRDAAIACLSPVPPPEKPVRGENRLRGIRDAYYCHGTNLSHVVCAFRPEARNDEAQSDVLWYLAVWSLLPGDDRDRAIGLFERELLAEWAAIRRDTLKTEQPLFGPLRRRRPGDSAGEREELRRDTVHAVANYPEWRTFGAGGWEILDHSPADPAEAAALTNEFDRARAFFAATLPSRLDTSNTLAVVRIYRDRAEYLASLADNGVESMEWSAAYWNASRRELVAHYPDGGLTELLRTLRHEAFHQYLAYAASMIETSPWFNEGYAQYCEAPDDDSWGITVDLEEAAEAIPALLQLDYREFYAGGPEELRFKYRLAWSVCRFLEKGVELKGARGMAFAPFRRLKLEYLEALLAWRDPRRATAAVLGDGDKLEKFIDEWRRYWESM